MPTAMASHSYTLSPESLWALIGSPDSISDWHPAIATSPVVGDRRTVTLMDGGVFLEDITRHSDADMEYAYRVVESPLPVSGFESTVSVVAEGAGSKATWSAEFEVVDVPAGEIEAMVRGLYEAGLGAVAAAS